MNPAFLEQSCSRCKKPVTPGEPETHLTVGGCDPLNDGKPIVTATHTDCFREMLREYVDRECLYRICPVCDRLIRGESVRQLTKAGEDDQGGLFVGFRNVHKECAK